MKLAGWLLLWVAGTAIAAEPPVTLAGADGQQLMDAVYERHQQYPWVFEEQAMILIDQSGQKETRTLRRYSRVESDGLSRFLLLFETPADVRGVALLAQQKSDGLSQQAFYLPALGGTFVESESNGDARHEDNFLGTDYSIENLVGENLEEHRYRRLDDDVIDETDYYVVDSYWREGEQVHAQRRHFIRKDNLYIDRTDHFDDLGRLRKRQTHHDLVNVHGDMWRANMMMMENRELNHRTVIKINRRVFSADYVPEEVFTRQWIINNQPPVEDALATEVAGRD